MYLKTGSGRPDQIAGQAPIAAKRYQPRHDSLPTVAVAGAHVKQQAAQARANKQGGGDMLQRGPARRVASSSVSAPTVSDDPITATLKALMAARGLTYRSLAAQTRDHDRDGRGVTHTYLCGLTSGREYPSMRSIELIAECMDVAPEYFAEYRLAQLQRELDGRRVGFKAAWQRYAELVG